MPCTGFAPATIRALQEAFKLLVKSRGPMKERQEKAAAIAAEHPEVAHMLAFLRESERGWVR